jgi:PTH1 family peptidyl-tRNA hydrolase
MNLSGRAVQAEMTRNGVSPGDLVVVHDDLDLPLGRLRLKAAGGAGGQKGVRDIAERIGPDFVRVKVGIGRPPERWTVENWVLSRFRPDEQELLHDVVATAADAVERLLAGGLEAAMNAYNGVDLRADALAGAGESPGSEGPDEDSEDQPNRPEM